MAPNGFSRYQLKVLAVLTLLNFINYVDRQIIFPLFPLIRRDFGLTYSQLGALATAFTVVLSLGTLPFGILADRISRKKVISAGVVVWSLATFLSGISQSFRSLLAARALVGIGEAAYTPAGTAIISATFPQEVRASVQGYFNAGMFIGGATGIALGGVLANWLGWRPAFFIVGIPGLLLAFTIRGLKEPEHQETKHGLPVRELLRVPAYVMILISGWFASFAGYGYVAWGPALVQEFKRFGPLEAGVTLGLIVVVAGLAGILTGAFLSDRLARRVPWGRVAIVPVGFVISAPLVFLALHTESKLLFAILFGLGAYFLSWYHGPVTAVIHDLIPSRGHGTAIGIYLFFVNFFAMAVAPMLIGQIADRSNLLWGLHAAVAAQLIGGLLFFYVLVLIRRHGLNHPAMAPYRRNELSAGAA
jgi:MFS family permease